MEWKTFRVLPHCKVSYRMLNNSEYICFLYKTNVNITPLSFSQVFLICLTSAVIIGGWKGYIKIIKVTVQDTQTLNQAAFFLCFGKSSLDAAIMCRLMCQLFIILLISFTVLDFLAVCWIWYCLSTGGCDHNYFHFKEQTSICLNSEINEILLKKNSLQSWYIRNLNGKDKLKLQCKHLFPISN